MSALPIRRRRRAVSRLTLILGPMLWSTAGAQPPAAEPPPFIEPVETHAHTAAVKALVEPHPEKTGRWDTLPFGMPINPVHVALMRTGRVLVVSGSGNDPDNHNLQAAVWDPKALTVRTFKLAWDMFCSGMVVLPDGRPFVLGGTIRYDPFFGDSRTAAFDPASEIFSDLPKMSGGRWYPTATVLGDGSVLVYAGLNDTNGQRNRTVQIWNGRAWTAAGTAFLGVPLYPREHLLPSGKVFESGSNRDSQMYDPATHAFTRVALTRLAIARDYGTSVLLPLTPANGWKPKVMILGGAIPPTNTTELIDLSAAAPRWVDGPRMAQARIMVNATLLPNGKVLVSGGSTKDEVVATAVKPAELYDPATNAFAPAGTMQFPRLYHSNTLLLPDGTVAALGGNPQRKVYQHQIEIYSPPYLFAAGGAPAKRPSITGVVPAAVRYGATFQVQTPDAAAIRSVVLLRAGAVTHSIDMEQRLVGLTFTAAPGALTVKAPANGNLAPPGFYLLFVLDAQGVPSVAPFLQLVR